MGDGTFAGSLWMEKNCERKFFLMGSSIKSLYDLTWFIKWTISKLPQLQREILIIVYYFTCVLQPMAG